MWVIKIALKKQISKIDTCLATKTIKKRRDKRITAEIYKH